MKTLLIVSIAIRLFAVSAHASDECNSLLSDGFASSIRDLANLRVELDKKVASGDSSFLFRSLEFAFEHKKKEILSLHLSETELTLDAKLKSQISKSQILEKPIPSPIAKIKAVKIQYSKPGILTLAEMPHHRRHHQVSVLSDDRVVVFGGVDLFGNAIAEVEIYNPKTNQFATIGKLTRPSDSLSHFVRADGKILVWGAYDENRQVAEVEIIDPILETVTEAGFKHHGLGRFLKVSDSEIFQADPLGVFHIYNFEDQTSHPLEVAIWGSWAGSVQGSSDIVYLKPETNQIYLIDLAANDASPLGYSKFARQQHTQVSVNDREVLIVGGKDPTTEQLLTSIETFDSITAIGSKIGDLSHARFEHTAVKVLDGRVVVIGGHDAWNSSVDTIEIIDPATAEVKELGKISSVCLNPPTVVLSNGDILLMGGEGMNVVQRINVGPRSK